MPIPLLPTLISSVGIAAAKEAVIAAVKKLARSSDKSFTPAEERRIHKEVESLIRLATDEDVKKYDPKIRVIEAKAAGLSGVSINFVTSPVKKSAAKKSVAKKGAVKRAAKKTSAKSASRKSRQRLR